MWHWDEHEAFCVLAIVLIRKPKWNSTTRIVLPTFRNFRKNIYSTQFHFPQWLRGFERNGLMKSWNEADQTDPKQPIQQMDWLKNHQAAPRHNQSDPDPRVPKSLGSDHRQYALRPIRSGVNCSQLPYGSRKLRILCSSWLSFWFWKRSLLLSERTGKWWWKCNGRWLRFSHSCERSNSSRQRFIIANPSIHF